MREILPKKLSALAEKCARPLYVVGGSVRDYLAGLTASRRDLDLCSPMSADEFLAAAQACGFIPAAVYRNTGTVKLKDAEGEDYEYTCFRSDRYVRGAHVPVETFFTDDIFLDAKRRDFKCNAVYYDIKEDRFVDPLGGISDIKARRLSTVDKAEKVFGEDGLRLMRLARQAGQLGFSPSEECTEGARANAALIEDISSERIWTELCAILSADEKYGNARGHYEGLKVLEETEVLFRIFPELAPGKGMAQRNDFHKYDVLEHTLRAVLYAEENVRLAALLHDVGKPLCMLRDGNVHEHPIEGARLAEEILTRLKAPKHTIERVRELVFFHMYDFDGKVRKNKLRRFLVLHADLVEDLIRLKQADYSGCMDDLSPCPTGKRWREELATMKAEGVPMKVKELAVSGKEIASVEGMREKYIGLVLKELLLHCVLSPRDNTKERLLSLAPSALKTVLASGGEEKKSPSQGGNA